jgi:dTDP-3-amino-3,4,6-trideoxy-alpha-D-glucose transaminase
MVSANDFRRQWEDLREPALAAFTAVAESGWYVLGDEVRGFEAALAACWGIPHAAGVASGLDAIEISLRILGCQPGDRVLTTPLSAFATTLAIVKLGAVPVFVDTDQRGLIDLARCRDVLSRRPEIRLFVPVHLYGHALDVAELRRMREDFDLKLVEDCAQSIGARFRGAVTGSAGQFAATSFYPTKNLGAMGDGGAILTSDAGLDAQARAVRDYGQTARYRHEFVGYNSRLDELHAALLHRAALPRLATWTQRRRAIARAYLDGIRNQGVDLAGAPDGSESCWHLFPVYVRPEQRESFLEHLRVSEVGAGIHYPAAIPDQAALAHVPCELADDCSTARRLCASEVSLPIHPYLTDDEIGQVIKAVNAWPSD